MFRRLFFSRPVASPGGWPATAVFALMVLAFWTVAAGPAFGADRAKPLERVTLQLKWLHQFQFAGYYAAQAKGFYKDEGLEVTLKEGGQGKSGVASVVGGQAQFAIADSDLLINRINGQPIVALAAIFQHSPYVILSRQDSHLRTPSDLVGKTVMLSEDQGSIQLRAMLAREGIDEKLVNIVPHSWKLEDLIQGKVDAVSAYATVEPLLMRARGIASAFMLSPDYGVDFYGDVLITTEVQLEKSPETTAAFLRATRKGWDYAMAHEDEIAGLILGMDGVAQRGLTRELLIAEARSMRPFILPDVVEIGHMNPARLEHTARTLADLGLVRSDYSLAGLMYEPHAKVNPQILRWAMGGGLAGGVLVALVFLWNMQIRRSVRQRTQELLEEVTHRTEVQRQLKASEELVQLMFGTAAAGLVMNTPDGRFLMANPAYYAITGYTESELRAMDMRNRTLPEDLPRYDGLRSRMMAGEFDTFSDEQRCVKKDGGFVWINATVSLVRSAEGVPTHVIAVVEDITARRATEEKLRQSEMLLAIAGRTARLGGWMLDLSADHVVWSDEVCKIYGVPLGSKPLRRDAQRYNAPEWQEKMTKVFTACIRDGTPFDLEMEIINASGRRLWIRAIGEALRDESGRITRIHGSCQDITERQQAQESILRLNAELEERVRQRTAQLEALNRDLECFSYSVSHDLRSPLNTIDGFSQLMDRMDAEQLGEKGKHYLGRIRAGARQMGALIDGLLAMAKSSQDKLHSERVDLSVLARQAAQECREREPAREVQLQIQDKMLVQGDPVLLLAVVQNLLGNAWKFTAKRAVAQITMGCEERAGGELVYFVKDNGAGFDMRYADKLFGTFQRLHSASDFSGSGIGLSTVQRIIFRHGGRVWAHAVEDQGAEFYFTLGLVEDQIAAVAS
ncbi:ABC transporter substrate-binding protein [Polaromonas sp. SM01]|uniref:ABC transporter substrate-binding protein n=1 Tax=Polaromonas sp. SM01 TaxID=3085630 RepID=UPI0029820C90|nr:ABC transporter substrate-binding protein [Polaromonas sp. SM01]